MAPKNDVQPHGTKPPIRLKTELVDGAHHVEAHIDEGYLDDAFGTSNAAVIKRHVEEIAKLASNGSSQFNEHRTLSAIELLKELAPKDTIEAMLASQMVAVHTAMIEMSCRLANAKSTEQLDLFEKATNRLARTFTSQMEALNKHRRQGTQKVLVQHVNVESGGQAVVGDVRTGGGR